MQRLTASMQRVEAIEKDSGAHFAYNVDACLSQPLFFRIVKIVSDARAAPDFERQLRPLFRVSECHIEIGDLVQRPQHM